MKEPAVSEICNIHFNMLAKARHAKEVKMSQYSYSHLEKEDDLDWKYSTEYIYNGPNPKIALFFTPFVLPQL